MVRWHQTLAAELGFRVGGMVGLSLAWLVGSDLYARVHSHPPAPATFGELGLCTILVALLVVGNALLCVGAGLWKMVPLPGQWAASQIERREFDALLYRDRTSSYEPVRAPSGERNTVARTR